MITIIGGFGHATDVEQSAAALFAPAGRAS